MDIRLTPETEKWLRDQVAQGRFSSIDEAIEVLIREDRAAQSAIDEADPTWARPYIERGLADIEEGRTVSSDEVHAGIRR